jgi:hypothetical protein
MERPRPGGRLLLGLRFAVVAAALLKLALLYAQNDRLTRSVTCLRAQLHDYAKSGPATDLKACGVSDAIDAAPSKEACAAGTDAATAEDEAEAFTAPRLATLAATLLCVAAAAVALRRIDDLLPPRNGHRASERLAYRIDCWFSSNPNAKILALLYVSIAMVLVGGLLLFGVSSTGFGDAIWENVALVGIDFTAASATESSLSARVVAVASALGGMFITALLLGIVSDAVGDYVDDLKKGRSDVLETNHTLVLGWSDKTLPIVEQVSNANVSEGGGVIVILAEMEKERQEELIAEFEYESLGTRVICREGNPLLVADLKKVNAAGARSTIILAGEGTADQADAKSLRVVLSLVGLRAKCASKGHIVCEMCDVDNEPLVRMVGGEAVETIVAHDVIGRLMIQCARQPGLAQVWNDVLGFEGCEFYCSEHPELVGCSFDDVVLRFADAAPLGLLRHKNVMINPPRGEVVQRGDRIIVLAEDDDSYEVGPKPSDIIVEHEDDVHTPKTPRPERVLFCGWRRDLDDVIQLLDDFVVSGSELHLFSGLEVQEQKDRLAKARDQRKRPPTLSKLKVVHATGDLCSRRDLERLPLERFTSCIILADDAAEKNATDKDSQALATLLLLRDIQNTRIRNAREPLSPRGEESKSPWAVADWAGDLSQAKDRCVVLSEILDARTRALIADAGISDYVLSNSMVSDAIAMVAEDRDVNRILNSLFEESGAEIYIRPAGHYIPDGAHLSFFDVAAACRARDEPETLVGFRRTGDDRAVVNPPDKSSKRVWDYYDMLVVLAED